MPWLHGLAETSPEIFLFAAIAMGTLLGRQRIGSFPIGASACILFVSVIVGQFAHFVIPGFLKSILFGLFVFTIGFRSGPQFFASLSARTFAQVALALVIGLAGLLIVLMFASVLHLSPGTAAGLASGSLTQSSMMGTASGALAQIGLLEETLKTEQANIAAAFAVTYILGYILVLIFVPFVAPIIMRVDLKVEAAKLDAELSGGVPLAAHNLFYRKFQARAYRVDNAGGRAVGVIESEVGQRAVVEVIRRKGRDLDPTPDTLLEQGDEILITGPSAAVIDAGTVVGKEIEDESLMRSRSGEAIEVLVSSRALHGRALEEIVKRVGGDARGVFLRGLMRNGREVPISPQTRVYIGDVATLVGESAAVTGAAAKIGQRLRIEDRTDIEFLATGLAIGLALGALHYTVGGIPLTLGGGGGSLIAGLACGWLHARRPARGSIPPAAQQTLIDLGLGGFIAAIGLGNAQPALQAIEAHGATLLVIGIAVTLVPMIVGTIFAQHVLRMNPVIICGALAGAMTVDAAVAGACEVAHSQTPVLGVAVPYAISNVVLTVLGPIIVGLTYAG